LKHQDLFASIYATPDEYSRIGGQSTETLDYRIYSGPDSLILACGGTIGRIWPPSRDWLIDFEFWKTQFRKGKYAEAGFMSEATEIGHDFFQHVEANSPKIVYLVGFSKGGAHVAILFDLMMTIYPGLEIHGVTCGAPRALATESVDGFDYHYWLGKSTFHRYFIIGDPVPHLPPAIFGYKHFGQEVRLPFMWPWKAHSYQNYLNDLRGFDR